MNSKRGFLIVLALAAVILLSKNTSAQALITGYASIDYDYDTNVVTGVVTTELDYSAQDWYQGMVNGSLYTDEGSVLSSGSLKDLDRDGTVSLTMQAVDNSSLGYTAKGTNIAIADIQDYDVGSYYYIDYWAFQDVPDREGGIHYIYMPYYGYGPVKHTSLRNLSLGVTQARKVNVGYRNAKLCNATTDYAGIGKASVTLDAAAARCVLEDPCTTEPDSKFDVLINFNLPSDTTALSGTDYQHPGRTEVKPLGGVPSDNEWYIIDWKYENVNVSATPKSATMRLTLHRRGTGEDITSHKIEVDVAGDFGTGAFKTPSDLRVVCP